MVLAILEKALEVLFETFCKGIRVACYFLSRKVQKRVLREHNDKKRARLKLVVDFLNVFDYILDFLDGDNTYIDKIKMKYTTEVVSNSLEDTDTSSEVSDISAASQITVEVHTPPDSPNKRPYTRSLKKGKNETPNNN